MLAPRCIKCCVRAPKAIASCPMCHISASEFVTPVFATIIMKATHSSDNVTLLTLEVHWIVPVIYIKRPYRESHIRCIIGIGNVLTNHFPSSVFLSVTMYALKLADHFSYWIEKSYVFLCLQDSSSAFLC